MQKSTVKLEFLSENSIKICAKGCCPIVRIEDDIIFIKDDFGKEVQISVLEALNVSRAVEKLVDGY